MFLFYISALLLIISIWLSITSLIISFRSKGPSGKCPTSCSQNAWKYMIPTTTLSQLFLKYDPKSSPFDYDFSYMKRDAPQQLISLFNSKYSGNLKKTFSIIYWSQVEPNKTYNMMLNLNVSPSSPKKTIGQFMNFIVLGGINVNKKLQMYTNNFDTSNNSINNINIPDIVPIKDTQGNGYICVAIFTEDLNTLINNGYKLVLTYVKYQQN